MIVCFQRRKCAGTDGAMFWYLAWMSMVISSAYSISQAGGTFNWTKKSRSRRPTKHIVHGNECCGRDVQVTDLLIRSSERGVMPYSRSTQHVSIREDPEEVFYISEIYYTFFWWKTTSYLLRFPYLCANSQLAPRPQTMVLCFGYPSRWGLFAIFEFFARLFSLWFSLRCISEPPCILVISFEMLIQQLYPQFLFREIAVPKGDEPELPFVDCEATAEPPPSMWLLSGTTSPCGRCMLAEVISAPLNMPQSLRLSSPTGNSWSLESFCACIRLLPLQIPPESNLNAAPMSSHIPLKPTLESPPA